MIVMEYAENGSLKKNLQNIVKEEWIVKLRKLKEIISELETIHQQKLIHCDFHHGNILNRKYSLSISDLGLCKPTEYFESRKEANKTDTTNILTIDNTTSKTSKKSLSTIQILKEYWNTWIARKPRSIQLISQDQSSTNIYGVLPFVAPEILRSKPYTTASDIYSFSMIMWEFIFGIPLFDDKEHNIYLALSICNGERPKIIENTPQCYIDLMKQCWNEDPLERPNASEISNIIKNWYKTKVLIKMQKILLKNFMRQINFWNRNKLMFQLLNLIQKHIIQVVCLILLNN